MEKGTNQLHGKNIEEQVKSVFPGASDVICPITAPFDIPAEFDKELNLSTSIKTTKGQTIELADARRFFQNEESFRLIVFNYNQEGDKKVFKTAYEYIIDEESLKKIKGNLSYELAKDFHENLTKYEVGNHVEARKFSKEHKKLLKETCESHIILNPKIDSKSQRRLQCSIKKSTLDEIIPEENKKSYTENYKGLPLPLIVESGLRKFREKKDEQ